jgi:hypothetical protein
MSKNRERELQEQVAALETAIEQQELLIDELGAQINEASESVNIDAVMDLGARYDAAQLKLDRMLEEWTQLAD